MSTRRMKIGSMLSAVVAVALAVCVFAFLPTSLGGRANYLITHGTSMQPRVHQGDLVILRETNDYRVGDAVAYRDPLIGRVFHRIIRKDGNTFVFQGDNNSWTDDYQPTQEEIVGKLWIHLPGAGKWLDRVRQPFPFAMLAAFAGAMIIAPKRAVQRLRRRAHRPPARGRSDRPQRIGGSAGILSPDGQMAMSVVGIMALATVILALLSFSRPTEQAMTMSTAYEQSGTFAYTAESTGTVYEGGIVTSGQPVYRALVDAIDLTFDYALTSDLPVSASGTYRLDAVVAFDEGLTRTIPLVAETPFDGSELSATATLALDDVQQVIDQIAAQIGADGKHTVSIVPTVNMLGMVGGQVVEETFAPSLNFQLDAVALRPDATSAAADDERASDPLDPTQSGTVEQAATAPATLSFLMLDVTVATARTIAIIGVGLSALGGFVVAIMLLSALRCAEPYRVRARYGQLLIQVRGSDLGVNGRVVDVASIEDLARVAEREGRMILHQQRGSIHDYFVQDVDVTYRYRITNDPAPAGNAMTEAARG